MEQVLIVDDNIENRYFLEVLLQGNGFGVTSAVTGADALEKALQSPPNLIISDILMPVMDGYKLCQEWRANERLRSIPFIFYTATFVDRKDEDLAVRLGADRFVIKPQEPAALMQIIRQVLSESPATPRTTCDEPENPGHLKEYSEVLFRKLEKKMAELELMNQEMGVREQQFRQFIMECPMPIAISNHSGEIELVNSRFVETLGYTLQDMPNIDTWWQLAYPDPAYRAEVSAAWLPAVEKSVRLGGSILPAIASPYQVTAKDGAVHIMEMNGALVADRLLVIFNDITKRKQAEEEREKLQLQLNQSQKMEALGQLASGVAHDFNNILSVIMGYAGILKMGTNLDQQQGEKIDHIIAAAEKASQMTRGLLTFSRKQVLTPKTVNLNDIVQHFQHFLTRIIGEDIQLKTIQREFELLVSVDSGQIEQVLVNLATNARDAMPNGGTLTIETGVQEIDAWFAQAHGYDHSGQYAVITVSDTGCGMSEEIRKKIFEPFFTTKEIGKGTGLGMAIVYGIIKQHNGFINLYSEPDKGTVFRIYLPLASRDSLQATEPVEPAMPRGGNETILVAEDDPDVRALAAIVLTAFGYEVITVEDGEEAVNKFLAIREEIDMILMDMIMPKQSGFAAAQKIRQVQPDARILFSSGYTADFINNRGVAEDDMELIMKPYQPMELLRKVREMLDR